MYPFLTRFFNAIFPNPLRFFLNPLIIVSSFGGACFIYLNIYLLSKRLGWDQNLIYINRESRILDMLDMDEIDPRVWEEFEI